MACVLTHSKRRDLERSVRPILEVKCELLQIMYIKVY